MAAVAARTTEPDLYRVEPEPGEDDDFYAAPTKVHSMAHAAISMMDRLPLEERLDEGLAMDAGPETDREAEDAPLVGPDVERRASEPPDPVVPIRSDVRELARVDAAPAEGVAPAAAAAPAAPFAPFGPFAPADPFAAPDLLAPPDLLAEPALLPGSELAAVWQGFVAYVDVKAAIVSFFAVAVPSLAVYFAFFA
jgi:hypothetical protein